MKVNSKEKILNILKESSTTISGENISGLIGISRTAVWKNIKTLIQNGYSIECNSKGYKLLLEQDLLIPYEFHEDSDLYIYRDTTESTMLIAKELILSGKAKPWSVVLTQKQTAGISKDGKKFQSPKGGLYFTMLADKGASFKNVNLYPMAALISIKEVLYSEIGIKVTPQWPFDTWYQGKKISGILHDFSIESNKIDWLNLGIGINLEFKIPRRNILIKLRKRIIELLTDKETILPMYIKTLDITETTCSFIMEDIILNGKVISIDRFGTITLESDNGIEFVYIGNSSQKELE